GCSPFGREGLPAVLERPSCPLNPSGRRCLPGPRRVEPSRHDGAPGGRGSREDTLDPETPTQLSLTETHFWRARTHAAETPEIRLQGDRDFLRRAGALQVFL